MAEAFHGWKLQLTSRHLAIIIQQSIYTSLVVLLTALMTYTKILSLNSVHWEHLNKNDKKGVLTDNYVAKFK